MGGFGCVPAVRDVGLLVGCIYGYGRLMWVRQSDPDGKLILNSPVGSSAVPSIDFAPEHGGPEIDWLVAVPRLCPPPVAHASSRTSEGLCSWSCADRRSLRGT